MNEMVSVSFIKIENSHYAVRTNYIHTGQLQRWIIGSEDCGVTSFDSWISSFHKITILNLTRSGSPTVFIRMTGSISWYYYKTCVELILNLFQVIGVFQRSCFSFLFLVFAGSCAGYTVV